MNPAQLHINFDTVINRRENNAENQAHLECNAERFSNHCRKVYELMLQGKRLNTRDAAQPPYNIGDLRARVRDLIKIYKVQGIKKEYVKTEDGKRTRFKEYFIEKCKHKNQGSAGGIITCLDCGEELVGW